MSHTTRRADPPLGGLLWYAGVTGASTTGDVTFVVERSAGSTVAAGLADSMELDANWADVVAASSGTSLAFLESEPDLYED